MPQHDDTALTAITQPTTPEITEPSIIETILDLDEFLSGDVRLAEKTARFCIRPDIEAQIDELEQRLQLLVDAAGRPQNRGDESLGGDDQGAEARGIAEQIQALRHDYADAMRSVRMRQLSDNDWAAFRDKHRLAFQPNSPAEHPAERAAMLDDVLVQSAIAPKITAVQLAKMRDRVGAPQIDVLIDTAFNVNTEAGVQVPKSRLSLAVLRQPPPAKS